MPDVLKSGISTVKKTTNVRQADDVAFNGKPIEDYTPSKGNCPGPGDVATNPIPCAPADLVRFPTSSMMLAPSKLVSKPASPAFAVFMVSNFRRK
jgi:hypothetical protein